MKRPHMTEKDVMRIRAAIAKKSALVQSEQPVAQKRARVRKVAR
jgi:hypothetical protein